MTPRALPATRMLALAAMFAAPVLLADDHQCTYKKGAEDFGYTATGIRNEIGPVAAVGKYTWTCTETFLTEVRPSASRD